MTYKFILFVMMIFVLTAANAFAVDMDLVAQELDRYSDAENNVIEVPSVIVTPKAPVETTAVSNNDGGQAGAFTGTFWTGTSSEPDQKAAVKPAFHALGAAAGKHKKHELSVGMERYQYKYHEYTEDGSKFMNLKGFYSGLSASYTFRPFDTDSFFREFANAFSLEARYASGQVDYTGATWSGTPLLFDGIKDSMFDVRALVKNQYDWQSLEISPYLGVGRRYLTDRAGAMPGGYNRESEYIYVPLGVDVYQNLPGAWGIGFNLEYEFLVAGKQVSHFENISPDLDVAANRQEHGFGWRTSLKVVKELPHVTLSLEPYYRYWHIMASKDEWLTSHGQMIEDPENPGWYMAVHEPENVTQELGVKMGVEF